MAINETKLNAKVESLLNEITTEDVTLKEKKLLHLRLINIQQRTRKVKDTPTGPIRTEDVPIIDNDIGGMMSIARRQQIYNDIKNKEGIDI